MDPKAFGERLREARELRKLTQEELVERLGGKRYASDISEYEHGRRKLPAVDLPDFARALGVPVSYFFLETLATRDDLEASLLEWFRTLPNNESRKRAFTILQNMEPVIIGGWGDSDQSGKRG